MSEPRGEFAEIVEHWLHHSLYPAIACSTYIFEILGVPSDNSRLMERVVACNRRAVLTLRSDGIFLHGSSYVR